MPRKVSDLSGPVRLRPQADYREADIYHRPAPGEPIARPARTNGWLQLGQALKGTSATLNASIQSMQAEQIKKETIEGDKWAEDNMKFHDNKKAWADLVREHPDLQGQSPHFQKGIRLAYLRNRGLDYHNDLLAAWNANGGDVAEEMGINLKNSNDPDALERWKQEYRSRWIKENIGEFDDVELYENFIPKLNEAESSVFQLHENYRLKATVSEREDAYTSEITKSMSHEVWKESSPAERGAILQKILDTATSEGMAYGRANDLMAGTLADLTLHYGEEEIFQALDHVATNGDVKGVLGQTGSVRKMREALVEKLEDRRWKKENQAWIKEQRHKEKATSSFRYEMQGVILKNKGNEDFSITDWLAEQREAGKLRGVNDAVVQGAISLNKAVRNADSEGELDFDAALDLRYRAMTAPNDQLVKDLGLAVKNGQITLSYASQLMDDIDTNKRFRGQLEDQYFRNQQTWIDSELIVRTTDGVETQESKTKARNAKLHFYEDAIDVLKQWEDDNTPWNRRMLREELQKIAKRVVQDPVYHAAPLVEAWGEDGQNFQDPVAQKVQGTYVQSVTPTEVLQGRGKYDYTSTRMFLNPDQLSTAINELETNGGGLAKQMADKLGVDTVTFLRAQATMWGATYVTPEEAQAAQDVERREADAQAVHEQYASDPDYVLGHADEFSPQELWNAAVSAYQSAGYSYEMKGISDAQELLDSLGIEVNTQEINME